MNRPHAPRDHRTPKPTVVGRSLTASTYLLVALGGMYGSTWAIVIYRTLTPMADGVSQSLTSINSRERSIFESSFDLSSTSQVHVPTCVVQTSSVRCRRDVFVATVDLTPSTSSDMSDIPPFCSTEEWGWPCRGLTTFVSTRDTTSLAGIVYAGLPVGTNNLGQTCRLPLMPSSVLTLCNLLMWLAIIGLIRFAVVSSRRGMRRRRAQCVHCGYELHTPSPICSECGKESR